jgi:hypothetical protein
MHFEQNFFPHQPSHQNDQINNNEPEFSNQQEDDEE